MDSRAVDNALRVVEGMVTEAATLECPACRGAGRVEVAGGDFPLARCGDCGLVFRKPEDVAPALEANIAAFETMARGWWESLYDRWNARERGKVFARCRFPARALEIGPGRGAFVAYLLNEGCRVEGVDISGDICADLESRFGVKMVHGTLDGVAGAGPYDLIAAHHVVEHVEGIASFLDGCRSLLSPGGNLLVSCPNLKSWPAAFRSWPGYEPYHCLFFTPESMAGALKRCGFLVSVVRLRQPFTGWWNVLSRSLARRDEAGRRGDVASKGPSRGARFLYNVVRFAGSVILLPLTIATTLALQGEELVVLAVKADQLSCESAPGAALESGRNRR